MPSPPEVATVTVAEDPATWRAAGFSVDESGACRVGGVHLRLVGRGAGRGVIGWTLRGIPPNAPDDLDGFPTDPAADETDGPTEPGTHPNGATSVDHLVLLTDDLDRTVLAAAALGLEVRRHRDHLAHDGTRARQAFFRVGEPILEVVGPAEPPAEPRPGVRTFGVAVTVPDLEVARRAVGGALSDTRDAVQPGRQVATVRGRELGLTTPLLLITPNQA